MQQHTAPRPPELWTVITMAVILIPLAACAFVLSFQMLHPVMLLAGWSAGTAWLGPVLIDLAAGAGALMMMVLRGTAWRFGLGLLSASTALSIVGNLAGHNIERADGSHSADFPPELVGARLPEDWQWVVVLLSIAAPVFVAVLVHAFAEVLMSYLAARRPAAARPPVTAPAPKPAAPVPSRPVPPVHATAERVTAPKPSVAPPKPAPAVTAPTTPVAPAKPEPKPLPAPAPAVPVTAPSNVTPIRAAGETSQKERAYQRYAQLADERGGDPSKVTGREIADFMGAEHWKRKVTEFKNRYVAAQSAAVNQ
ncbi:hypothetical protein JOF41_007344 [Saccharothrix coeruleofusca]|uniref:hypothetical protein n=1 Tax=Saccharothrix coeruleofusca TaxID=33919 RepID=UPI001AE3DD91|nr:hypothetical protein [Saccharothrix coeruleofusca]MBP2341090.1 hypothetical protein [Saccharothrix coeruleofusca]